MGAGGTAGALEAGVKGKSVKEGAAVGAAGAGLLLGGGKGSVHSWFVQHPICCARPREGHSAPVYSDTYRGYSALGFRVEGKNPGIKREPTIYEVLPLEDRESVKTFLKRSPASVRNLPLRVNQRAAEIGPISQT